MDEYTTAACIKTVVKLFNLKTLGWFASRQLGPGYLVIGIGPKVMDPFLVYEDRFVSIIGELK